MDINMYCWSQPKRRLRVVTYEKEEVGNADKKGWQVAHLVDSSSFEAPLPSFTLHRSGSDARCVLGIQRPVAVVSKPYSRFAIADRDGRRATVVTACINRLPPASANDVARVGAVTPPSSFPLKNADDPAGGRIGVHSQILAETLTWHSPKMLRRWHKMRSAERCASHSMTSWLLWKTLVWPWMLEVGGVLREVHEGSLADWAVAQNTHVQWGSTARTVTQMSGTPCSRNLSLTHLVLCLLLRTWHPSPIIRFFLPKFT